MSKHFEIFENIRKRLIRKSRTKSNLRVNLSFSQIMTQFMEQSKRDSTNEDGTPNETITLEELILMLRTRAYGVLYILFAAPNCLILPPGASAIFGLPLLYLSYQMLKGNHFPKLPNFLKKRSFKRQTIHTVLEKIIPYVKKLEKWMKPRLRELVLGRGQTIIAATIMWNATMLFIPLPLTNYVPALAILIFGLSLLERDGRVAIIGYIATIFATIISASAIFGLITLILKSIGSIVS